jgi:hypothetical protein
MSEPLRDRLPTYLAWFAVEVAAASLVALAVARFADAGYLESLAGSLIGIGALSLLAGGASGGGFITAGDYGINYGRRHDQGWSSTPGEIARAQDLRERMRHRLRPKPNPTAFWQVIGGIALIGLGMGALGLG